MTRLLDGDDEVPGVGYRGKTYRARKEYSSGTHRAKPPEETFEEIRPFLREAGVTRIADVTGLDRVGIPTTLAIRPNSGTIACSSGKGPTLGHALTSGAMEAFELHAAETADLVSLDASYDELATQYDLPEVTDLQLRRWNLFSTGWPVPWSLGWDMVNQRDAPVPTPLVGMFRGNRYVRSAGSFHVTSNGLGAGNTFLEAIAAALYEVIERDAVACSYAAEASNGQDLPVVQESTLFQYPLVEEVMRKCERAGVAMIVHDCTIDTGVPTYNALAFDMQDQGVGVTKGSGSHLDPGIAILRATTEALQARLNFIAGSRDDVFRSAFARMRSDWGKAVTALTAARVHSRPADNRSSRSGDSFEEDISILIEALTQVGLSRIIVFDLTPPGFPITVVRVVVPGLEGYQHHGFEAGSRVRRARRGELSHALS